MRHSRQHAPTRSDRSREPDRPPPLTGDLDTDVEATLAWLWSHPERWLADDAESAGEGGDAA
jgi:hypothetical protein